MNCSPRHNLIPDERAIAGLLEWIRVRFYAPTDPAQFHRDRRGLIHALTWPAVWLERRGLFCSPHRYRSLAQDRLSAILAHGDPARYGAYLPTYLLKCLQDFFAHHGDDLYCELKHVRNALDLAGRSFRLAEQAGDHSRHIEALAAAHRILHSRPPGQRHHHRDQLRLF
jgi:hypothetical protein